MGERRGRGRWHASGGLAWALAWALAISAPAAAQEPPADAVVAPVDPLLRSADQLVAAGEHDGALALLQRLQARAPAAGVEGRMAIEESALGQHRPAEVHAEAALQAPDDPWVTGHMQALAGVISESARHLGTLVVDGLPAGTTASIGGTQVGVLPSPLRLVAGATVLLLTLPSGRELTFRGNVQAQQTSHMDGAALAGTTPESAPAPLPQRTAPVSVAPPAETPDADPEGLEVSAESVHAWQQYVAEHGPAHERQARFDQALLARSKLRVWLGVRYGLRPGTAMFRHYKPGYHRYDGSGPLHHILGAEARVSYRLTELLELSGGLAFDHIGAESSHRLQDLTDDPLYSEVFIQREGTLYRLALDVGGRFGLGLSPTRPGLFLGLAAELDLVLFPNDTVKDWRGAHGQDTVRLDNRVAVEVQGSVKSELGAYLNQAHTLEIASRFQLNRQGWEWGLLARVALTGWVTAATTAAGDAR